MYEGLLRALIKLTVLITKDSDEDDIKRIGLALSQYLNSLFDATTAKNHMALFHTYFDEHLRYMKSGEAQARAHSQRQLETICEEVNEFFELDVRQQLVLRLVEFSFFNTQYTNDREALIQSITKHLQIDPSDFENIRYYTRKEFSSMPNISSLLIVSGDKESPLPGAHHKYRDKQVVMIYYLYLSSTNQLFVQYSGDRNLYLNSHKISQQRIHTVPIGAIMKTSRIEPIYYNNIINLFTQNRDKLQICYTAKNISFAFSRKVMGIHPFSLTAKSGELIGIMGGSGVGKSTLFNLLNGNIKPDQGNISINGFDLHQDKGALDGLIGYVPQDDLLIEELTVFDNLYYNAKLCFHLATEKELHERIDKALHDFDLIEARDLVVGNPLKKIISGGQRKRLNIALELMREPAVLFADEPTSGLSSADSEKIMYLFKRQCLKGGLVFANIHQPSSDIFKLLDGLIILDKGGRMIYQGNPMNAITYFKHEAHFLNPDENECLNCGTVKTEQPLRIIETRIISPIGKQIRQRKVPPQEWYERYRRKLEPRILEAIRNTGCTKNQLPKIRFKIPPFFEQFKVFLTRDIKAKRTNKAYVALALLQAPLLALMLSYFTKYTEQGGSYHFGENVNLPSFLFMSVVVALFVGLTVSAEEIFKDRKLLKREEFLNLSRSAYLSSKIITLFALSAVQTLLFVLIGNYILEIKGLTLSYWLILFTTSCFANVLGLNLSAGLNSAVAIYISIPLLLVPQLIFSGVVVNFKNMHPILSSQKYTMVLGDMTISRWGYEALAVNQYCNNDYYCHFFKEKQEKTHASYLFAYYIPRLNEKIDNYMMQRDKELWKTIYKNTLQLQDLSDNFSYSLSPTNEQQGTANTLNELKGALAQCLKKEKENYHRANAKIDSISKVLSNQLGGSEQLYENKMAYHNQALEDMVKEQTRYRYIVEEDGLFVFNKNNIYHNAKNPWGRAHFYAPYKTLGKQLIPTVYFNIGFMILCIAILVITLYFDALRHFNNYIMNFKIRQATLRRRKVEV